MTLIDCEQDVKNDISQVYSITEDKEHVNLQDYYEENDAFDEDSGQFLRTIKKLMNREDFYRKDEDDDENEILGIPDFIYIDDRRMLIGESIFSYLLEMDYSDFAGRKELEEILDKTLLSNEEFIKAAKIKDDKKARIAVECGEYEEGNLSISIVLCEGTAESKYLAVYDTENFETDNDDYFERIFSIYKKIPHYMIEDKGKFIKVYEFDWSCCQAKCGGEIFEKILKENPVRISDR